MKPVVWYTSVIIYSATRFDQYDTILISDGKDDKFGLHTISLCIYTKIRKQRIACSYKLSLLLNNKQCGCIGEKLLMITISCK